MEFDYVLFRYKNGREVPHDFCLTVQPGQTIALVDETGAGKSTIVNLVCRFYEPTGGSVKIDGADYRTRSQLWLQSRLGYPSTFLFNCPTCIVLLQRGKIWSLKPSSLLHRIMI